MCGRFAVTESANEIISRFKNPRFDLADFPIYPSFNISPTTSIAIATKSEKDQGQVRFSSARWGLVPSWADSLDIGARMINARSEKALAGPVYKDLMKTRRCIIPVSAWYEWQQTESGSKQPYAFKHPKVFYFAGLYDFWRQDARSPWQISATILTQDSVGDAAKIHERMPLMLNSENIDIWLSLETPAAQSLDLALNCSKTLAESLQIWKVSTRVNRVSENSKELLDKYEEDGLALGI